MASRLDPLQALWVSFTKTSWKKSLLSVCCGHGSALLAQHGHGVSRARAGEGLSCLRFQSLPIWSPCKAHANKEGGDSEKLYQDFFF